MTGALLTALVVALMAAIVWTCRPSRQDTDARHQARHVDVVRSRRDCHLIDAADWARHELDRCPCDPIVQSFAHLDGSRGFIYTHRTPDRRAAA